MEYSKIELKGYKFLQLNNIQLIRAEPKHTLQLILGSNGSGKTKFLREITPLPSNPSHYEKGGYKLLELSHKNNQYQILNTFDGKSGKYQLFKNGSDIFSGNTVTDFRSLIKQEFGITPEIQSLIDGVTRFSTMDVAKRRYWFTQLCHADYTYAIGYYKQLRSRIRDLQGSLTISQHRHLSEISKRLSEEEVLELRKRLSEYKEILHRLLELKPRTSILQVDIHKQLTEQDTYIEQLNKRISQIQSLFSRLLTGSLSLEPVNPEYAQQLVYKIQAEIEQNQRQEDHLHTLIKSIQEQVSQHEETSKTSVQEQEQFLIDYSNKINQLNFIRSSAITINVNVEEFKSAFDTVYEQLEYIFNELPEEGTNSFTRKAREYATQRYQETQRKLQDLQKQIQVDQNKISEMEYAKIHHLRECPSCHHRWYHGYNETSYLAIKTSIDENLKKESELIIDLQKTHEWMIELDRVFDLRTRYSSIIRSWSVLQPLWSMIADTESFRPRQALKLLEDVRRDIPILLQIEQILKQKEETKTLIRILNDQTLNNVVYQESLLSEKEDELHKVQEHRRSLNVLLSRVQKVIELFKHIEQFTTEIEKVLSDRQSNIEQLNECLKAEHFNRLITIFRQEIVVLEQTISKIDIQETLILQLEQQIKEHEEQVRLLKLAEQAMSPSTGLIAKGLTGFINWFISKMNLFVKHIWVYPLEILPVTIQDELELNYQFPLEIDGQFTAPDVKVGDCNASTCEVFDLAFRIVAMECLGLRNFPLQLDEFGSSFDAKHRNVAFNVVTNLTTISDIPQIFMVSHFADSYGSLRNVDVTVLDDRNIVLPDPSLVNVNTYIA